MLPYAIDFRTPEQKYLEKRTADFESIFEILDNTNVPTQNLHQKYNANISPLFYDKQAYDEYMNQNSNTELETQWKTRILLEYTPRGNVSMYYDPFKMGFAYQCDQKTVSYELLNACAMKYVKMYRCLDFFVDELNLPETYNNPLIPIYYSVGNTQKSADTKSEKNETNKYNKIDGPFIKRKKQEQPIHNKGEIESEKMKNKFLYVGKISNTTFLNTQKKTVCGIATFKSPLLDSLEKNADVQNQRLTYKDFKYKNLRVQIE
jgi:hypothetical protein